MKQHITRKQLKELSDDGYIKLYAWNKVKRNISTISTVCPHPRFRKEPLLSIGKMIEFLVDNKTNWFVTGDFVNWNQMDFGGIDGEVTAAGGDTTNLYLGFTTTTKSGKGNGGMYKKPIEQLLVGIEDENISGLSKFSLEQNHPNPFSQSTNISYSLKKSDFVSLKVYDFAGREIRTLINNFQEKGIYSVVFNAENLPNGIYTYKLQLGNDFYKTKKMMLIK